MKAAPKILIVGFGDVGQRLARMLISQYRVYALVRKPATAALATAMGATPLRGDLAKPGSLQRLAGKADVLFHFAPPPGHGHHDTHTRNLLAALLARRAAMLPQRVIYISTTGVYGDCHGDWIDENRPIHPTTDRARRRVDAERNLGRWCRRHGVTLSVLRAPGIYSAERLPRDRLARRLPVLADSDDVYSNHIHADDLARAALAAMKHGHGVRYYNVVDDSAMKMGDYFDLVADHLGMPRPPRVGRMDAGTVISPAMLSFMQESRRIRNDRLKRELRFRLDYPTVATFLAGLDKERAAQGLFTQKS
jgi:nucleoside-diphosphate-sugar epimerase